MTRVAVSKWGNSSAIRLPKAVMEELGIKQGEVVEMTAQNGKGVIEKPKQQLAPSLEDMVAEMTRLGFKNEPEPVDWGLDVGSERFYDHDCCAGRRGCELLIAIKRYTLSIQPGTKPER
jgi:antitoxin MazE